MRRRDVLLTRPSGSLTNRKPVMRPLFVPPFVSRGKWRSWRKAKCSYDPGLALRAPACNGHQRVPHKDLALLAGEV